LQLDRLAAGGQSVADKVFPAQNQAGLAKTLFGQQRINRAADEIGERDGIGFFSGRRHAAIVGAAWVKASLS
jgi:hypothetical protein